MAEKPADFLIGVVDFFAVMLPGAVITFFGAGLARDYVSARSEVFGPLMANVQEESQRWVLFIIASYILGQFVYLFGSLMDGLYDTYRKAWVSYWNRARKFKQFLRLGRKWAENELLYKDADEIKKKGFKYSGQETVNTYQWSKAKVQLGSRVTAVEIQRLEGNQKFFRSLMVVLLFVCFILLFYYKVAVIELTPFLALIALSFWRYLDQRRKGQNMAYTYLIVLDKAPKVGAGREAKDSDDE